MINPLTREELQKLREIVLKMQPKKVLFFHESITPYEGMEHDVQNGFILPSLDYYTTAN